MQFPAKPIKLSSVLSPFLQGNNPKEESLMSKTTTAGIQSVERRLHTRHRARTTVYITTPTGRKKLCRAINLSATGVFVETTNLGLRKGQQVELAFAINLGAVTKLHRRTAVVAHDSRGGTGLLMEADNARPSAAASAG
jgi:hypothetical protein